MERADDFDAGVNFARRLEAAESLIAGGNDLGNILVETKGSYLLNECVESRGRDGSAQSLYKGRILLQG